MSTVFLTLAILLATWGTISLIVISAYVSRHGIRINIPFLRLYVLKYVHDYYNMTRKEQGKPGPWFYSFIISMNGALVMAILGFILWN